MRHNSIAILGIPLDNLTMEETVESVFSMIEEYHTDKRPRQVCTVNTDFVVNTLSWSLIKTRHPELMDILRKADLVTADGMPLVWASRLLGSPLKGRVTGADLVPELAREASQRQKSIYLLGGKGDVAIQAARILEKRYPDLIIAGCDSPFVHIEGEALIDALESDLPVVDRINASGADILLIAFGNPKQELWFERNRHRLKVPVSIGIGGTFEFITGSVQRAPAWMQHTGLEWLFRLTQDPRRLWKRYLIDFLKFGILVWPSILHYHCKKLILHNLRPAQTDHEILYKPLRDNDKEAFVLHMPWRFNISAATAMNEILEQEAIKNQSLILDFSDVLLIDSNGLGFLLNLYYSCMRDDRGLFITGLRPTAKRAFSYNRMSDLLYHFSFNSIEDAQRAVSEKAWASSLLYYEVTEDDNESVVSFFGELTAAQTADKDTSELLGRISTTRCTIDLSHTTRIDSSGIIFILKFYRALLQKDCSCTISGISQNISQMVHITKMTDFLYTI
ncbi:MAG TPA: WecB/TagA/CpsF family glycosyltransferase [Deltaproteobacteria bacterium]|nr:WecB/TagA/CpsF family glycosyltransferase [Deltaproteobacteria bacterium]